MCNNLAHVAVFHICSTLCSNWSLCEWHTLEPCAGKIVIEVWNVQSISVDKSRNIKRGIRSFFDPCVNAMGQRPYCLSRIEANYCTFGFGVIIRRDLRTLSLQHDSSRNNLFASSPHRKGNSRLTKFFGGLSYEKVRRYNNSPPYMQQDGRLNKCPL